MFTGKVLYISKQKFPEVPPELWEAKAVENLTIVGINMAQIPSEIQNLKTLTKLCVSENNLTAIPKDLCALTNLASFDCTMNEVEFVATSSFPPSLTSLTFHNSKLKVLDCDSPLPNLTSLMLVGDNLPAVAPSGISSFHALRALNLSYNPGLEEPPASFSGLTSLETVKIVGCSLKMFPACFYKLKRLNTLHLTSNRIEGFESASDGSSLENMTALKTLDLSENLIKSVPDSLFEMRLSVLLIQSNKLSEIPSFGRICETLNVLDLSENYIKKLPKSFYNLREIRTINLR